MSKSKQMIINDNTSEQEQVLEEKDTKVRKFKSPIRIRFAKNDA